MMAGYKLLIFDLDGTLIDSLPYHFLAFKDLLLEHGISISDSLLRKLIGMPTSDILKNLKARYRFKEKVQDLREERRYHYFKFLGSRNIVFPAARDALEALKPGFRLAVATGSSKVIFTHSTERGFQDLFDVVVTINDVRKGKPHPGQLLLAARRARARPAECLVVGDSIYDAVAARAAGMDFVGVTTGYNTKKELMENGAIGVISSLSKLGSMLK